ncbi:hypothetical protein Tco_0791744 [Tanacetum coccineum]
MPPTPHLSFTGLDEFVNRPVVKNCKAKSSEEEPKVVRKNNDALIIEEWVSDDEEEDMSQPKIEKKTVRPSIVKIEFVKSKQQKQNSRKNVKQVDCNYHQKQFQNQRMVKPVWNNAQRVNHQNFAKKSHPCAKKNMAPEAILMKSGLVSINTARQNISKTAVLVNTARQVNVAHSKTTLNAARPMSYLSKTEHSTVKRPIYKNTTFKNNNINQRVNTVRGKKFNTARPKAVVNAVKGNKFDVVKASNCWVWKPKNKVSDHGNPQIDLQSQGVIDSGCSRYMTGNISYLIDYEEIDGGYVTFEGNPKGGKITGKGTQSNGFAEFLKMMDSNLQVIKERMVDEGIQETIVKEKMGINQESIELPDNLNMHALEDYSIFDFSRDDDNVGAEADINNLDTTIQKCFSYGKIEEEVYYVHHQELKIQTIPDRVYKVEESTKWTTSS